jgi:hypothetical protein
MHVCSDRHGWRIFRSDKQAKDQQRPYRGSLLRDPCRRAVTFSFGWKEGGRVEDQSRICERIEWRTESRCHYGGTFRSFFGLCELRELGIWLISSFLFFFHNCPLKVEYVLPSASSCTSSFSSTPPITTSRLEAFMISLLPPILDLKWEIPRVDADGWRTIGVLGNASVGWEDDPRATGPACRVESGRRGAYGLISALRKEGMI